MKKSILLALVMLVSAVAHTQSPDSIAIADFRLMAGDIAFEHPSNVRQLMDWNDSLRINRKRWSARYDSLCNDSLAINSVERRYVQLDAALLACAADPSAKSYSTLKLLYESLQLELPSAENFNRELNALMLEIALSQRDFTTAYAIQNKLHAAQFSDWKQVEEALNAQLDSLENRAAMEADEHARHVGYLNRLLMQWHVAAVVAIALLIILACVWFLQSRKWNRQRAGLTAKAEDTSEKETLVHKLEEARREIQELKLLAKKKLDVPVVVPDPAPVPVAQTLTAAEIAEWNDQVQLVLAKIKSHCEAGKNSMGVPTYMSIVNDVTRLSNQVSKKSEQWIAVVSGK